MTASLDYRDDIAILTIGDDENRFSPDWLDAVGSLLNDAEANAKGLITVGDGKFYSNGLDLDWLIANGDRADWYVEAVQTLLARILTFSLPTVAAVNGHAFGAGAMFAIAHDFRIMRADRGYYCFPEVDINIPFTPGMAALIQAKLSPICAHRDEHRPPVRRRRSSGRRLDRRHCGRGGDCRGSPGDAVSDCRQGPGDPRGHQVDDVRVGDDGIAAWPSSIMTERSRLLTCQATPKTPATVGFD